MSELLKVIEAAIAALQDYEEVQEYFGNTIASTVYRARVKLQAHAIKERVSVVAFERERLRAWNNTWRQLKEEKRER